MSEAGRIDISTAVKVPDISGVKGTGVLTYKEHVKRANTAAVDAQIKPESPQIFKTPEWFENQTQHEKAITQLQWEQMAAVQRKLGELHPKSPDRMELQEVFDTLDFIEKHPDKAQYNRTNGEFTNKQGRKDNFGRYYTKINKAAQAIEGDDPQLKAVNDALRPRLFPEQVTVEGESGQEETIDITTIDRTEVKSTNEIINLEAKQLFRSALLRLGESGLAKTHHQLTLQMFTEFVSLTQPDSTLPSDLRLQMIADLITRMRTVDPDIMKALGNVPIEYRIKDAKGNDMTVHSNLKTVESEVRIKLNQERLLGNENPVIRVIRDELTTRGFSQEDIEEFLKLSEGQNLDSWDYITDIERMGFEYAQSSDSILGDFSQKLGIGKIAPRLDAFKSLAKKDPEKFKSLIQGLNGQISGSFKGVSQEMLLWGEQNLQLKDISKKLGREKKKFKWENWSMGLLFAYSFLGPFMGAGEEDDGGMAQMAASH